MMNSTQRSYSEFPPLRGLWTPKPLNECGEVLEHLRLRFEVPVGILFLCLTGVRDLESWFVEGISRPQGTFQVVALDQPQAHVNGADLVNAALAFEEGETDIRSWAQLCALALWSELRGAAVSCRWADQALCVLRSAVTPEALFFPWVSPAWQHDLVTALRGEYRDDNPHEMALRRGLNPVLIRGLNPGAGSNGALDAAHFVRARALLRRRDAVARRANPEADFWRLDRYFSPEATGTSLGVAAEIRRFRADLFRYLRDSNRDDECLLIADALLHLREHVPVTEVSCNSFLFRWRTRHPFSYQQFTLGELHQVLSFLDRNPDSVVASVESVRRSRIPARRRPLVRTGHGCGVEPRHFQVDLHDHRTASGTVFWVPAHTIGQDLRPDIAAADKPKRLSAIVKEYEEATGRTVIVAVNGGYFLDTRTVPRDHPEWFGKPVGFLKCDGQIISGPFYTDRPVLCLDHEYHIALRFVSKGLCSPENAPLGEAYIWSDDAGEYLGIRAAIEAGPLLLKAGRPDLDLEREQWDCASARAIQAAPVEMSDLRTARTAIAMTRNGDIYLVTVHGRVPESVGMTHTELANWLQVEIPRVDWAMEMDAGGSVTAWHVDAGVTTIGSCLGGSERLIASAILFSVHFEVPNWQVRSS